MRLSRNRTLVSLLTVASALKQQDAKKKMLSESDTNKRDSADDDIRRKAEVCGCKRMIRAESWS